MDTSTILALLGGGVGFCGGICGFLSLIYQRKQTRLMQEQMEHGRSEEQTYTEWVVKYDQAIEALIKISPGCVFIAPAKSVAAMRVVFPDEALRRRIQRYLGRRKFFSNKFEPCGLSRELALSGFIQALIQEVLDLVEKFKREHPDWARALKLLRPV